MISVPFQGKPFNITVIQVYAPMYSIYIEIIQMIYKNDPLNKSSKNCFLFTTLDLKNMMD